jgi:dihydrofolate reductase
VPRRDQGAHCRLTCDASAVIDHIRISLICAMARNRTIGRDNRLPWKLHTDMQHFRRTTMGKPVVMGRKTFQSFQKPLPGRLNVVLSRDKSFNTTGVVVVDSLDEALSVAAEQCRVDGRDELFVIGGAEVYAQCLARADRLYLTLVHADIEGDTWFPEFDCSQWQEEQRIDVPESDRDSHASCILHLSRIAPSA